MLIFSSCAKDGEMGPAGPAGISGSDGTDGTDGNANVTGSNTVILNNWVEVFNNGTDFFFSSQVNWPGITQDIVNTGAVLAYVDGGGGSWVALPTTTSGNGYTLTLGFQFKVGTVTFYWDGYDNLFPYVASDFNGDVVRIVAITSKNLIINPDVNLNDYYEVKKAFNL